MKHLKYFESLHMSQQIISSEEEIKQHITMINDLLMDIIDKYDFYKIREYDLTFSNNRVYSIGSNFSKSKVVLRLKDKEIDFKNNKDFIDFEKRLENIGYKIRKYFDIKIGWKVNYNVNYLFYFIDFSEA